MELTKLQEDLIDRLMEDVNEHFASIEQSVPPKSFVVGGAPRDTLLGLDPEDFDFMVLDETQQSMRERGFNDIEATSFPVFLDSEGQEWALARTEQKDGIGYSDFTWNTKDVGISEDLSRRDLTINSIAVGNSDMAWDEVIAGASPRCERYIGGKGDWMLFDETGSVDDINQCVIRHNGDAFEEDPLRILRVARYAARLPHFTVSSYTNTIMNSMASELNLMSRDRIGMEIKKAMLQAREPSVFFETLADAGVLSVLWPDLDRGRIIKAGANKYHAEGSVFEHTMLVIDRMVEICDEQDIGGDDRVRRLLMALVHDIGKVKVGDKTGGIHSDDPPTRFGGHADQGAEMMEDIARRLGFGRELESVMEEACKFHMKFHEIPSMPPSELLDFVGTMFPTGAESSNNHQLPTTSDGEPHRFFGATAWELLDLAQADHEGRIQVDESGNESVPELDRDQFVNRIEAVFEVENSVDGYEALESGLCDEHSESVIDRTDGILVDENKSVSSVMSSCTDCTTPGDWVSVELDSMKAVKLGDIIYE